MTTEVTTSEAVEDVQQTLQGYLTVATRTGELRGTAVEFTADGVTWSAILSDADARPVAVRATVHRAGWAIPTVITELWDEVLPADQGWRDLWLARPHVLSGAHALRTALRRTFADVLGDRREPDDMPTPPAAPPVAEAATEVDWSGRVAAATTIDELAAVRAAARAARAVDLELKRLLDERRAELEPQTVSESVLPPSTLRPRAPQDYQQPANRAARRKSARKKGGRR